MFKLLFPLKMLNDRKVYKGQILLIASVAGHWRVTWSNADHYPWCHIAVTDRTGIEQVSVNKERNGSSVSNPFNRDWASASFRMRITSAHNYGIALS